MVIHFDTRAAAFWTPQSALSLAITALVLSSIARPMRRPAAEDTRTVELTSLVESLCDDLAELDVTFQGGPKVNYRCRPDALRRAIRNLIEIAVTDDGPGIPDADREQVFTPFFRLEDSRNRETGGVDLGLSIARHHGGDAHLRNLEKGLSATITLPKAG